MNRNTTLVLGAIAIALFGYITVYERDSLTSAELEGRRERLFSRFVRNRVERVVVERESANGANERIELYRELNDDGTISEWLMESPTAGLADDGAVGSLLGALEWSDARRAFAAEDGDLSRFGLENPRITVQVGMGNETLTIWVGDDEGAGGGVYVSDDGGETIKVAGLDIFEALDHDGVHFQSKRLLAHGMVTTDHLSWQTADTDDGVTLRQAGGAWRLADGRLVSASAVEEALDVLSNLEAESYPEEGLGEVRLTVEAQRPSGAEREAVGAETLTAVARFGGDCDATGQVRVQVTQAGEVGPVACVARADRDALERQEDALLERRPAIVSDPDLTSITVERNGRRAVVARGAGDEGEGTWTGVMRGVAEGAQEAASFPVDGDAALAWLRDLRRYRATTVSVGAHDVLQEPMATIELTGTGGGMRLDALVVEDGVLWVRRTLLNRAESSARDQHDEAAFDPSLLGLFDDTGIVFRSRQVLGDEAAPFGPLAALSITRLEQRGESQTERIAPSEAGDYRVEAPAALTVDAPRVEELSEALCSLRAERFVREDTMRLADLGFEHGIDVRFRCAGEEVEGDEAHRLQVGTQVDGGSYARLDEGPVFLWSNVRRRLVDRPLVATDLLSVPTYEIDAITLERDGRTMAFHQRDGQFIDDAGEAVDDELMGTMTRALGRLHGRPIVYAEALDEEAELTVTLGLHDGSTVRLWVGPPAQEGTRMVVREGVGVLYRVDENALRALLTFRR